MRSNPWSSPYDKYKFKDEGEQKVIESIIDDIKEIYERLNKLEEAGKK